MSFELIVQPSAKHDIVDADAYYAQYGKADAFIAALDRVFTQIAERPLMYPIVYEDVRRALMRRFPYSVFFIVERARAVVLAVHHQRRDPASRPRR
jgi:plasmid stabilization system protein ParE